MDLKFHDSGAASPRNDELVVQRDGIGRIFEVIHQDHRAFTLFSQVRFVTFMLFPRKENL